MLDIKLFRETPDLIRDDLKKRKDNEKLPWVDKLISLDKERRELQLQVDKLRQERNAVSQEINQFKKEGKDAKTAMDRAKAIPSELKELEDKQDAVGADIKYFLLRIPNLMHESVPYGKDDTENEQIRSWGVPRKPDFELKNHGELAESLGSDFDRSAKIAGAGFYYLKGDLALLNQALIQFAIRHMVRKGYTYVEPPLMMRKEHYQGVVDLGDFEKVMYKIEGEDSFLIATSEHPLIAQYANEILEAKSFPIKLVGYSMCFRREIGSHGVDTKGFFRTHQFNKVEQVVLCKPEDSWEIHEELQRNGEEIFEALELPYRVVNICTGDLGSIAAKKYDTEVWMAKQQAYKEVLSCSHCTDYQARRLGIRYRTQDGNKLVHTLNNTALATSRVLVAILEHYQNEDGSVTIPEVLQPAMGKKKLDPAPR
ncbi:MAG: serine--tRNA ligase [Nanoarchaeota archaeon]